MSNKAWIFSKINRKIVEKSVSLLLILVLIWQFGFPKITSLAQSFEKGFIFINKDKELTLIDELGIPTRTITVPITAYSSTVNQTDSTPCITANGFNLCKNNKQNIIAANFLPFGTKVMFPDYDPETIYTVQDRMNKRYTYRADIWMETRSEAKNFGKQNLKMEIYQ